MSFLCKNCFNEINSNQCPYCNYKQDSTPDEYIELSPGTPLDNGRYIIGKVLGRGGFGITYLGYDNRLQCKIAIKEYLPSYLATRGRDNITVSVNSAGNMDDFEKFKNSFINECRMVASLSNINVVAKVHNYHEENNTAYMIMEYVDGVTLKSRAKKSYNSQLSVDEIMNYIFPVIKGLEKVHERSVYHRDISPDNIMISKQNTIKLIDFGTARQLVKNETEKQLTGFLKEGFTAPEQVSGGRQGAWTDIYSICATIYFCLTGTIPVESPESRDKKVPVYEFNKSVPIELDSIIQKGLSYRYQDRFQDCNELCDTLSVFYQNYRNNNAEYFNDNIDYATKSIKLPDAALQNNNSQNNNQNLITDKIVGLNKNKDNKSTDDKQKYIDILKIVSLVTIPIAVIAILLIVIFSRDTHEERVITAGNNTEETHIEETQATDNTSSSIGLSDENANNILATAEPTQSTVYYKEADWDVYASSSLKAKNPNEFNYDASNVLDGGINGKMDCWLPNDNRDGVGEYLCFTLENGDKANVTQVSIINGAGPYYDEIGSPLGNTRYGRNCRAKDIIIEYSGGTSSYRLADGTVDYQVCELPSGVYTDYIKITFVSVYYGADTSNNTDLMISEVEIDGEVESVK